MSEMPFTVGTANTSPRPTLLTTGRKPSGRRRVCRPVNGSGGVRVGTFWAAWLHRAGPGTLTPITLSFTIEISSISTLWKKERKLVTQSCSTLCKLMDCSLPGSSVHRILQARILEWVATPFSRGSFRPRDWTRSPTSQVNPLLSEPPAKLISALYWWENGSTARVRKLAEVTGR